MIEMVEKVSNPNKDEGEWIMAIDLVESGDKLLVKEMEQPGTCRTECKTAQRAAEEVVESADTDMAEKLWQVRMLRLSIAMLPPVLPHISIASSCGTDVCTGCTHRSPPAQLSEGDAADSLLVGTIACGQSRLACRLAGQHVQGTVQQLALYGGDALMQAQAAQAAQRPSARARVRAHGSRGAEDAEDDGDYEGGLPVLDRLHFEFSGAIMAEAWLLALQRSCRRQNCQFGSSAKAYQA